MSGWRWWGGQSGPHVAGVCCHGNVIVQVNIVGFCKRPKCDSERDEGDLYWKGPFSICSAPRDLVVESVVLKTHLRVVQCQHYSVGGGVCDRHLW